MRSIPRQVDLLIVGNGALGLSLADVMAEHCSAIAVVGPADRAAGASQAAGAMLGCFGEVTTETLRTVAGRKKFELSMAAQRMWPAVLERLAAYVPQGAPPLQVAADSHLILNSRGSELDSRNFRAVLEALAEYGSAWEEVDPEAIPGYRPRTDHRALRAIRVDGEGAVDARRVLQALQTGLEHRGVHVVDGVAVALTQNNDAVTGVRLEDGSIIEAGTVVVTAGARSQALLQTALEPTEIMPMFAGRGVAMVGLRTEGAPFETVVRTTNRAFACGLHVIPLGGGREYFGATNGVAGKPKTAPPLFDIRFLVDCAMEQLDEGASRHDLEAYRIGNRPVTLDGFPLIGWSARAGLYIMTGTYRDGFHCAPLLASHAADQLRGGEGLIDPMFTPTRAPIATRTVEQSVDEFVNHSMAAWFESGANAARQFSTGRLEELYRQQGNALYDRLGIDYGLSPDLLAFAFSELASGSNILRYLRSRDGSLPAGSARSRGAAGAERV